MLKMYKITVDGKSYEVEVDDLGTTSSMQATPSAAPVQAAAQAAAAKPAAPAAPAAAPAKAAPAIEAKGDVLRAPMPGTILSVAASVGKNVKRGEVLLVLEAMKMENEIVAHVDGTIASIHVQKGSTVNAGDALVAFA